MARYSVSNVDDIRRKFEELGDRLNVDPEALATFVQTATENYELSSGGNNKTLSVYPQPGARNPSHVTLTPQRNGMAGRTAENPFDDGPRSDRVRFADSQVILPTLDGAYPFTGTGNSVEIARGNKEVVPNTRVSEA